MKPKRKELNHASSLNNASDINGQVVGFVLVVSDLGCKASRLKAWSS